MQTRRAFTKSILAAPLAASTLLVARQGRAATPDFEFKIGTSGPAASPIAVFLGRAADRIKAESSGHLELKVFADSLLGGDTDMITQVRTGALDFCAFGTGSIGNLVPHAQLMNVGFAWHDYPTIWKAIDGDLGAYIRAQISKVGLTVFDKIWDIGFREVTTSVRPINTVDDLKGLKIRVPVTDILFSLFRSLGAAPTSLSFGEVYSALQTKLVDGQEAALVPFHTAKLYEVQKYCSLTHHAWESYSLIANTSSWTALPKDVQEIVRRNFDKAALEQREESMRQNAREQEALQGLGIKFNQPSDPESFRKRLREAGYYQQWKGKFGPEAWGLLEKYAGSLA